MKKLLSCCWVLLFVFLFPFQVWAQEEVTFLFTHDMHSHLESNITNFNGNREESGGFGKLKTAIDAERKKHPTSFLVDAGDFSMGTLYQTIFTRESPELRLMGQLGYDAVTLGNHEFDFRTNGLTAMLHQAMASGDPLPNLLIANIDWEATLADSTLADDASDLLAAMSEMEVQPYKVYEKDGVEVAIFGIFGKNSADYAPLSGLIFADPIESAKATVAEIKENHPNAKILCLSHSGTAEKKKISEDQQLAINVPEIDVIVSGHTHTVLDKPLVEGDTLIVSAGSYLKSLGTLTISAEGGNEVLDYQLIPLDETVANDPEMEKAVSYYTQKVNDEYLADYSYTFDQVIASSPFDFSTGDEFSNAYGEDTLGSLIADSFVFGAEEVLGTNVDITAVPTGCVRSSFSRGDITIANIFDVYSLGSGADGKTGYPLVSVYIQGKDLKNLCEIDASVSHFMAEAQLHFSGLSYTYNPNRLFMNRVTDVKIMKADGTTEPVDENKYYSVVADLYAGQMLGAVEDLSFGLLKITPRDQEGNPLDLTKLDSYIIHKDNGEELKAWESLAMYMESFEKVNGVSEMPQKYADAEGRKVADDDNSLGAKLASPNKVFWLLIGAVALVLVFLGLIIFLATKLIKRHRKKAREKRE